MFLETELIEKIVSNYGTPVWIYDQQCIEDQIRKLQKFDIIRYAQKANSNIHILKIMRANGVFVDSVSEGEIHRSILAGYTNKYTDEVVYTSDVLRNSTLEVIIKNNIPVNIGSLNMIEKLGVRSPGHKVWIRINPGFGHGHSKKTNTGGENSKHGIWYEEINKALTLIKLYKLKLIGLHVHIGSGVKESYLKYVCNFMVEFIKTSHIDINSISTGGGLPIKYRNEDEEFDVDSYFNLWDKTRKEIESHLNHKVTLEIEPGRFLVASAGVLVSKILSIKNTPKHNFIIVDAGFNDLLRPSMYGSYHKIDLINNSKIGKEEENIVEKKKYTVAGPLCESGDVFTQNEQSELYSIDLPTPHIDDFVIFNDTGAYGSSMSSNYNSHTLSPEVLIKDSNISLIRKRQSLDEMVSLEMQL